MRLALALLLLACCGARAADRACPSDFRARKAGGCWMQDGQDRYFVHPAGWLVEQRCFDDPRFSPAELRAALDAAAKKFSPAPESAGGCLGTYNPAWGREISDRLWKDWLYVRCPGTFNSHGNTCANAARFEGPGGEGAGTNINVLNARVCMDADGPGLAGLFFHETLHADGADSFPTEKHNRAQELPQYIMIHDRVYATEALCFLPKPLVNVLQCREAVKYNSDDDGRGLCQGFNYVFYDVQPPGFFAH